jgi:hypothetical protein
MTTLLCAFVLAAGTAHGADSADDLAHAHFESGAAYLEQADYDSALREFNAAYDLSKRAEILLNVATVYERMGKLKDAVSALERYLAQEPQGEHAETVKIRVENLKKRLDSEPAPSAAPSPTPPPAAPPPAAPAPNPAPPPAPAEPTAHASRMPAYVLFAAGGAFAVGSIVTGIVAESEHSNAEKTCSPNCTDSQLSTGRAMAVTSTVLTGTAVVAAAVGAVLFFGSGSDEHTASVRPRVGLGVGPGGVAASAAWRF